MATLKELLGQDYKEDMTAKDLDALLTKNDVKLADLSKGNYVSADKYNSLDNDFKKASKELADKMTDSEKKAKEVADREASYKQTERELKIYKYSDSLVESVADTKTRGEIATLMADDRNVEAITKLNEYNAGIIASKDQTIKSLKNKDVPPQGNIGGADIGKTKSDFEKMSYRERVSLYEADPDEYQKLKGN